MISLVYISIFIVLFAVFNALVILWQQNTMKKRIYWSKMWHILGRIIIGAVVLWEWYNIDDTGDWPAWVVFFLTVGNLSWTIWDLVINAFRKTNGTKIEYLHIDQGFNNTVLKVCFNNKNLFWGIRFSLIVINIGLLIYLYKFYYIY